ncbi:hypothetical protein HN695_06790 [Candidatus Woesearchaeota archaeon]|jgi:hypothetical protein|nr:hypothetical protein [Candidatus Woesearchaeota archaeon]MBT5271932.1 hypothetical protein [Candidatus Woesearchaeota archaeon]MBT6041044.1 hypothetical protein [Candidatus Woesearchaeota archaeon]MBT6336220.1 hypothetical protein [Candidatus Woesearchaeota archaeon]MBT7928013.1 hypothetical protein [Candidatus Woesearchaeota archaeon]
MVEIVQKLPYGIYDGKTKKYLEVKCKSCGIINDVESWMAESFLEVNCDYCRGRLDLAVLRR